MNVDDALIAKMARQLDEIYEKQALHMGTNPRGYQETHHGTRERCPQCNYAAYLKTTLEGT